jgi:low affinity Fe/Cu permease
MRKVIYILLLSNFAFAQTATLDSNTILIGQQINFTITNKVTSTKIWPTYNEFLVEGIEIIKASKIDTTDGVITQEFVITAWDSGSYFIPPIAFSENSKTEGLLLNVQTIILAEDAELKDIKQPIEEPIGWSDIWPWLLGILILSLIIFIVKKYIFNKNKPSIIIKPKVIIAADISALKELNALEKAKIWQEGNVKEYHSQLSEIIRRYTENRFDFIALELGTDEIISELKSKVNNEQLTSINILLQRADLAKFAKSKPIDTENMESMVLAKGFVNATKQIKGNE